MFFQKFTCSSRFMQIAMLLVCLLLLYFGQRWWIQTSQRCVGLSAAPFIVLPNKNPRNIPELPNLSLLKWPKPYVASYPAGSQGPNGRTRPLPGPLEPVMSMGQRALFKKLLRLFSDMMFANGMGDGFFLAGGTLVGTFMFHDLVPWDDDMDVFVDIRLRSKVQSLLKRLPKPYKWYAQKQRDKLFTTLLPKGKNHLDLELSRHSSPYPWGWPFLDICYFQTNRTHFWEVNLKELWNPVFIPRSVIFPTYFRPLGEEWYPAPRDTDRYLRLWYRRKAGCFNNGYSHVLEGRFKSKELPCQMLLHRYAQVKRKLIRRETQVYNTNMQLNFTVTEESLIMYSDFGTVSFHELCLPVINERTTK
ncbi:unnamed protein product [Echinostoma caproni]|uniref:Lipopolysaccharide choline phosphotransferase n=1 Tax=Echinostoma caproni TaxID=27848 RepID=A0A183ABS3_9TREM|nr:unnamed protein product [Echinostoma caproni]